MEGFEILSLLGILKESMNAISKNGKLLATITTISILLNSLLLFTEYYSTMPALSDYITQENLLSLSNTNFATKVNAYKHELKDIQIVLGYELLFLLPSLAIYVFSLVIMVHASVIAYTGRNSSFGDFRSRILESCFRTLVTSFHLLLLSVGYIGLFLVLSMSLRILYTGHPLALFLIVAALGFLAVIFFMYLVVVWDMALVISVIEKSCYGLQAFGKAEGLVKGKRLHGFTLIFLRLVILLTITTRSYKVIRSNQESLSTQLIYKLVTAVFTCLVDMAFFLSYTVLYFQCKKTHGEDPEVELQGSLEYSKIPEKLIPV